MKAIFVDGGSLGFMMKSLGVEKTNLVKLRGLLANIGEESELLRPVLTVPITAFAYAKAAKSIGFDVLFYTSGSGSDDLAIIERLNALDEDVREVILVTGDGDFIETLLKLHERGVRVHVVSTTKAPGVFSLNAMYRMLFESGQFHFVEIADFAESLAYKDALVPTRKRVYRAILESDVDDPAVQEQLTELIQAFARGVPELRCRIPGQN